MGRLWAVAFGAAVLGLGGCNLVHSDTAMFTASDAGGQPALKPGLWAAVREGCAADLTQPAANWGECAQGLMFTADALYAAGRPEDREAYVLASGDPRVLQLEASLKPLGEGAAPGSAAAKAAQTPLFLYFAVKPDALDAQGRVTAAHIWLVQCGAPPAVMPTQAEAESKGPTAYTTDKPLPGLTLTGDGGCTPAGADAVRRAAKASGAWSWFGGVEIGALRWVRDKD